MFFSKIIYIFRSVYSRFYFYRLKSIPSLINIVLFLSLAVRFLVILFLNVVFSVFCRPKCHHIVFNNTLDLGYVFSSIPNDRVLVFLSDSFSNIFLSLGLNKLFSMFIVFLSSILFIHPLDLLIFHSRSIIVFEGDKYHDMLRCLIAKTLKRRSIIVQRGSFIRTNPTPVQRNFICSDFLCYDNCLSSRIAKYSSNSIVWHLIKDPYIISNNAPSSSCVYFVGQPQLHINSTCEKCFQPLPHDQYIDILLKIFEVVHLSNFDIYYIKHPQEEICFDPPDYLKLTTLKQCSFGDSDIFIGFYSSLLLQIHYIGQPLISLAYYSDTFDDLIII